MAELILATVGASGGKAVATIPLTYTVEQAEFALRSNRQDAEIYRRRGFIEDAERAEDRVRLWEKRLIALGAAELCPDCGGTGRSVGYPGETCELCLGARIFRVELRTDRKDGTDHAQQTQLCGL